MGQRILLRLGLGYLTLERSTPTLSPAATARDAGALEPVRRRVRARRASAGLHPADTDALLGALDQLKAQEHTPSWRNITGRDVGHRVIGPRHVHVIALRGPNGSCAEQGRRLELQSFFRVSNVSKRSYPRAVMHPVVEANGLGALVWTDDGCVIDLGQRQIVNTVRAVGSRVLVRTTVHGVEREMLIEADLRTFSARHLRTGSIEWTVSLPGWVSGLTVVHAGERSLIGMTEVRKWGSGKRLLADPVNGSILVGEANAPAEAALGPQFDPGSGVGSYFGSAEHRAHYASVDQATLRIHSATDGSTLAEYAASGSRPATTTTQNHLRVTTTEFDFVTRRPVFFSEAGYLLIGERLATFTYSGTPIGSLELPPKTEVLDAQWRNDAWELLVARDGAREIVQLTEGGLVAVWPDCKGVLLRGGLVLTAELGVNSIDTREEKGAIRPSGTEVLTRAPGPIPVSEPLREQLARLRWASKEKRPVGLSLTELEAIEAELGRPLPSWAAAVLAAQATVLKRAWSVDRQRLVALNDELRSLRQAYPCASAPEGLVAFGKKATKKVDKSRARTYQRTDTHYWCFHESVSVVITHLSFVEFVPGKDAPDKSADELLYSGNREPSELLAPVTEEQRKKNWSKGGFAQRVAELETIAVAELLELPITP